LNNRRKLVIALGVGALAAPVGVFAQQQSKVVRIGFLGATSASDFAKEVQALQAGLRELGYVEGKNLVIEFRWAEGKYDQLPVLAADLIRLKVELVVTRGTPASHAMQNATGTIPIVMYNVGDPIVEKFARTLAHPGGNITGFTNLAGDVSTKQLEMLLAMTPKLARVAVVMNPANASQFENLKKIQAAAQRVSIKISPLHAKTAPGIEQAFATMTHEKIGGVIVLRDAFLNQQIRQIANLAMKTRLPSIASIPGFVDAGSLLSYGPDSLETARRVAIYVDKILRGAKAGDLPVEQPIKFELIINGRAAKALGLKIPQSLLITADKVIE
jgi:putative ABC transport system substrate-binding protein